MSSGCSPRSFLGENWRLRTLNFVIHYSVFEGFCIFQQIVYKSLLSYSKTVSGPSWASLGAPLGTLWGGVLGPLGHFGAALGRPSGAQELILGFCKASKRAPRGSQRGGKGIQGNFICSKTLQDPPNGPQDPPKWFPRGPQEAPKRVPKRS